MNTKPLQALAARVGRRIAELRHGRDKTQERLAAELGISSRHLQAVEAGRINVTLGLLARFASCLGVSLVDLFAEPREGRPPPGRPRTRPAAGGSPRRRTRPLRPPRGRPAPDPDARALNAEPHVARLAREKFVVLGHVTARIAPEKIERARGRPFTAPSPHF